MLDMRKKKLLIVLLLVLVGGLLFICITELNARKIPHSFASMEEATELIRSNNEYYGKYTQNDIDFRMRRSGATIEELIDVSVDSVKEFNILEKFFIDSRISKMYRTIKKNHYTLPNTEEITFVKMNMDLEGGASGYTQGTEIYLNAVNVSTYTYLSIIPEFAKSMDELLWHEMFHCLTRNNKEFKSDVYSLINFTVVDTDYELPECLKEKVLTNPDVEHHNSYATFMVDGREEDCFVAWITTKDYAEVMSGWSDSEAVALVPINGTDAFYLSDEASNFDEIFGTNTSYVIDPEECLADNFAYAMLYGTAGPEGQGYPNPEIIQGIIDILKQAE